MASRGNSPGAWRQRENRCPSGGKHSFPARGDTPGAWLRAWLYTERVKDKEKLQFLAALGEGKSVTDAAKEVGLGRRTFYDLRESDEAFAEAWDYAKTEYRERLLGEAEAMLRIRALDRDDKFSHILLIFLLKRLDPAYKESYKQEVKLTHEHVQEFTFSQAEIDEAMEILKMAKGTSSSDPSASESPSPTSD